MLNKLKFIVAVAAIICLQWIVGVNSVKDKNIVEILLIVDKEFADLFRQDEKKITDYLQVFFWDINSRFKSLRSVDVSLQITDLMIIKDKRNQPFVENARNANGKTDYEKIFNLFRPWLYTNRGSLPKYDLAFLITNSQGINDYGIATPSGACQVDEANQEDLAAVVVYDIGQFKSMGVAAHEIGHALGSEHDDEVGCPKGFLMWPDTANNVFFFSSCTDRQISTYLKSKAADCLRRIDATKKTSIDKHFSSPKAGTMLDVCKLRFGPEARIDKKDESNCRLMRCQSRGGDGEYVINELIETVENVQCTNRNNEAGRCFRGNCRRISKLLQHLSSGQCVKPESAFGKSTSVIMAPCPTIGAITPLDTIEIMSNKKNDGKRLSSPYLDNDNKKSGDKCLSIGAKASEYLWTNECDPADPLQMWEFEPIEENCADFNLINRSSKKCLRPVSNGNGSMIQSVQCTTENDLIWKWFDGQ